MKKKDKSTKINKPEIKHIYVFGVGAAGSQTALNLIYIHPELEFTVVDFDIVEARNIEPGTQPYAKADMNRPKTQAFVRVAQASKNKKVNAINQKITNVGDISNIVKNPEQSIIVDAFDNAESRNIFLKLPSTYNVVHIGFSAQMSGEAAWDDSFLPMATSKADAEIDICEMAIARPFVMALAGNAAITISDFIRNGSKTNFYYDRYLNIKKY